MTRRSPDSSALVVIVSPRTPPPDTGGPMGVLRLLLDWMNEANLGAKVQLIVAGQIAPHSGVIEPAGLRRIRQEMATLIRLRKQHGRLAILQFEYGFASILMRLLWFSKVTLTISEHSRGGPDRELEREGASARRVTLAAIKTRSSHLVADVSIWPSRSAQEQYWTSRRWVRDRDFHKGRVVHNGIAAPTEYTMPPASLDPLKLLIIASSAPEKGVERLLSSLQRISAEVEPTIQVVWVGGDRRFVETDGKLTITARGKVSNSEVRELLIDSHATCLWPDSTIFDLSILEAMAYGRPPIVPPLPGFVEALGDNYPLYFNSEDELKRIVVKLHSDYLGAVPASDLQSKVRQRFNVDTMMEQYFDFARM